MTSQRFICDAARFASTSAVSTTSPKPSANRSHSRRNCRHTTAHIHTQSRIIDESFRLSTKMMLTIRVFAQVSHVCIFLLTCTASSRAGASIKALMPVGLCCFKWCMIGSTNAAVFPLPVGAHAMIFRFWQYKNRTNTVDDARSICTNTKHNYRTYCHVFVYGHRNTRNVLVFYEVNLKII